GAAGAAERGAPAPASAPEPAKGAPAGPTAAPEDRYAIESELGSGGSGRILLAHDQRIGRRVAMKVLREDQRTPRALSRLAEEAQATGQLEHPNIPPVYDAGEHPEHGPYFTLRLVRGRTLREILRDISVGRAETARHFTLTRLVQILQQVAMGIHYAHSRGVVHRDLKPENIMVGDFGEVQILDWGVAKVAGRKSDSSFHVAPLALKLSSREETADGTVSGTLSYMAPEQARGWVEDIDHRTDIFGLGAVLYEILTFHPPYEGRRLQEVLERAGACDVVPPRVRAPRHEIPPSLELICLKALAASKEDRHQDAMAFHEDLQVFLDGTLEGERRAREAGQHVARGKELAREYRRLAEAEAALRLEGQRKLELFQPHDPVERKAEGWTLFDLAARKEAERIQVFSEATALLQTAINIDPASAEAKAALAELYWQRFEEAERAKSRSEMAIYRRLVERHDQGRLAARLEDKGLLTAVTSPPGALAFLRRVVEREWRLAEEEGACLGTTPLKLDLPTGDYVLVLRKEGYRDTRFPVHLGRGEKQLARVNLHREEEIGEGFVLVPQGELVLGGDPAAPGSLPAGRRFVGDFLMAELPVTFGEYSAFLDDLRAQGDPDFARWLPRTEKEGDCVRLGPDGRHAPAPEALDIDAVTRAYHAGRARFEEDLPVVAVSWHAAERYAAWLAARTGRRVRLPRDLEWEKAARGVAGWTYPWGDRFDWSFMKGGLSRPGRAQPEPVGAFPTDRSIYGVRDLAGTIREWCQDWFLEGEYRLTRGGAWSNVHEGGFRAAHRLGSRPDTRSSVIGFRVAADVG
ncbi:MAG: SUMF1/EgtB/PvdO family nonheme iron enzyme, partial [Planctomycetes bacterium]|nr:SUMF1/EgtB/PvdO family nonheme iron enzyme [Planctomycetota bacterium]